MKFWLVAYGQETIPSENGFGSTPQTQTTHGEPILSIAGGLGSSASRCAQARAWARSEAYASGLIDRTRGSSRLDTVYGWFCSMESVVGIRQLF